MTSPVNPSRGETSIWNEASSSTKTSRVDGEALSAKSGGLTTSSVMSTVWVREPLVPTTARGNVPAVSVGRVRTLEPEPPTMTGWGKDGARGGWKSQGDVAGEPVQG